MRKKRILTALLVICMCIGMTIPVYAVKTELTVDAPQVLPEVGGTFEATVSISGNPGLGAVQFALSYDKKVLECTKISVGDMFKGALVATNHSAPSGARIAAATTGMISGDGVVVACTFKVLAAGNPSFALKDAVLTRPDGSVVIPAEDIPNYGPAGKPETQPTVPVRPNPGTMAKPEKEDQLAAEEDISVTLPQRFTDVPGNHWAFAYIEKAADMGLVSGYADGSFRPGNQVTRAQFVTMLWRMAGKPESSGVVPFTDITGVNAEFKAAIAWAYEKGYIGGRTATTFAPSDPLSRQAAMKVLFLYTGGKSGQEVLFTEIYNDRFTDSAALADWARTSLYWAVYNELISGTSDTTLGAAKVATRGQLAKILVNYSEKIGSR